MTLGSYQCFRIGAGALIALAIVHMIGHIGSLNTKPANGMEDQMRMLMSTYKANMMGTMRSTEEIVNGLNIAFSVFSAGLGALGFVLTPQRKVATVYAVLFAALTAVSLVYWFAAPTSFLAAAAILFGASALLNR